tara:strand:- start:365 stop:541 length:177 start_codon:yes stop_codon:yes gene_type:complete
MNTSDSEELKRQITAQNAIIEGLKSEKLQLELFFESAPKIVKIMEFRKIKTRIKNYWR